jgi:hypothetical protein
MFNASEVLIVGLVSRRDGHIFETRSGYMRRSCTGQRACFTEGKLVEYVFGAR